MSNIERMIRDIESEVAFTRKWIGKDAFDPRVMDAMRDVPRHEFVPDTSLPIAYANGPAPIGHGQTISQPYIVALMTDLLQPQPEDVMLEVGTGSGYQAAVLSRVVRKVYSMEQIEALAGPVAERLQRLGYDNVEVHAGDGYFGWEEHAPFDGIIVTAAAPHVPAPLLEQLAPGARLVIPVGGVFWGQTLKVLEKQADGSIEERNVLDVAFVPLTGLHHNQPAELQKI
ncbi:MAG: protein-L-isoaspartate(D-aspartate) O-methyltransferase [Pseudomonadota bacterium]|nr:MAG: protein-L-isoaspartate(D-aspartate) O-methyltransferase [Pseudomonadota bacterium]